MKRSSSPGFASHGSRWQTEHVSLNSCGITSVDQAGESKKTVDAPHIGRDGHTVMTANQQNTRRDSADQSANR